MANLTLSANMDTLLQAANFAAARTSLGVAIGVNVQAYDADLTALAALTFTQNSFATRVGIGSGVPDQIITIGNEFSLSGNTLSLANSYIVSGANATLGTITSEDINVTGSVIATDGITGSAIVTSNGSFAATVQATNLTANRAFQWPNIPGTIVVSNAGTVQIGTASSVDGAIVLYNGSNGNSVTYAAGAPSGDLTLNPPTQTGTKTLAVLQAQTFLGKQTFIATGTGAASATLPHGTAPSAPVDGDVWTTSSGMFVRINGSTVGPLATASGSAAAGSTNQIQYNVGGSLAAEAAFTYDPSTNTMTVDAIDLGASDTTLSRSAAGIVAVEGNVMFAANTKNDILQLGTFAADSGSTDAYACTYSPAITSYVTGVTYKFKANTANTGAATIDINGLGAKTIVKVASGITTTLADNDIRAGQWVEMIYDGTNMQMQSMLGNAPAGAGTVTSVAQSFTGGLISVAGSPITGSGTLALTVAGTSGGIPYFNSASSWLSSAALAANALMIGGGAGAAPATTTTGTGVLTALGVNVGSAGAFVTFNGALGTPSSGVGTNLTGTAAALSIGGAAASLSVSGQTGLITFTGLASTNRIKTVRDAADTILELGGSYTPTGTWTSVTMVTPVLGTPTSGNLTNCTADGTDAVGFRNVPSNSQSAAYTAVLADAGKGIDHPSTDANARTFTIPANGSVAYAIGTCLTFTNMTSQVVTIAITTDTMYLAGTGTTGSRSLAQYGIATARKLTSTTWLISGTGLT